MKGRNRTSAAAIRGAPKLVLLLLNAKRHLGLLLLDLVDPSHQFIGDVFLLGLENRLLVAHTLPHLGIFSLEHCAFPLFGFELPEQLLHRHGGSGSHQVDPTPKVSTTLLRVPFR